MLKLSRGTLFVGCVLLLAILIFFRTWIISLDVQTDEGKTEIHLLKEATMKQIELLGAEEAYQVFKETVPVRGISDHTQAHVFGEALYEIEGFRGVHVCDSAFAFGCYHSFFGIAIHEQGVGALSLFDEVCRSTYGKAYEPCQHGIGHGVLAYTGYDALESALELCEIVSSNPTGGCSSGVFMEYNFRTMGAVEGGDVMRDVGEDIYAPCNSLSEEYQQSCYLEQVQWWEELFDFDYEKLGGLCNALPVGSLNFEACFHGIGNYLAAYAGLDPVHITSLCALMPDRDTVALCHEGASWLVRGDGSGIDEARRVCEKLPQPEEAFCSAKLKY